jgi:hypothetical protein
VRQMIAQIFSRKSLFGNFCRHKGIKNSPGYSRTYKMKVNESCENLEDDHDEESISNKGKEGSKSK